MPFNITPEFVQNLLEQLRKLTEENHTLLAQNDELTKQIAALTKLVDELRQTIKDLEARLNKNPRNSSRPPSSEGYEKPSPKSNREPSGRKPGGQTGHKGNGLKQIKADRVDEIIHDPIQCHGCPCAGTCERVCTSPVRHEYDIEVTIVDRQHRTASYACRMAGGETVSGTFPDGINASQQYGNGIRSFAAVLNTEGMMGIDRIHDFLSAAFLIPCSTGFINNAVKALAGKLRPTVARIADALQDAPVVNCDETGFRTDGKLRWVHSVCSGRFTYLAAHGKRGREAMEAVGFLPGYHGIAVHDCRGSYWDFAQLTHGLCNGHILRELKGHQESCPDQEWIPQFRRLLQEMDHYKNEALQSGSEPLDSEKVAEYLRQYDEQLEKAADKNPIPERKPGQRGRIAKGKLRSLIDRLIEHKDEFCLFLKICRYRLRTTWLNRACVC